MPTSQDGRRVCLAKTSAAFADFRGKVLVAVGYIASGPAHVGSPLVVRLTAAVIVTACAAVAKIAAGPRAAAATAVVGVLIAVVVLTRPA